MVVNNEYLILDEAPCLSINNPDCDACCVEVDSDGDGYICPSCGTFWGYSCGDGEAGELLEEWAGEVPEGPRVSNGDAWLVARFRGEERVAEAERVNAMRDRKAES